MFWGAGSGSEGGGQFGLGVALVGGEVDTDGPLVDVSLVALSQDRLGFAGAGQVCADVAELPAVADGWLA